MIRRSITTMTLAAMTTIVIATAAPALAAPPTIDLGPIIDITLPEEPCVIESDFGPLPCPVFDWDLGGSIDVGGVATDTSVETVVPEGVLDGTILPDIDLTPLFPLPAGDDESAADEGTPEEAGIVRITPLSPEDLDALRRAATPSLPTLEPAVVPEEDATIEARPPAGIDSGTDAVASSSSPDIPTAVAEVTSTTISQVVESTTTTVAGEPVESSSMDSGEPDSETAAADLASDTGSAADFSLGLAALIGGTLAIALAGTGFGAYRFGQRGD